MEFFLVFRRPEVGSPLLRAKKKEHIKYIYHLNEFKYIDVLLFSRERAAARAGRVVLVSLVHFSVPRPAAGRGACPNCILIVVCGKKLALTTIK